MTTPGSRTAALTDVALQSEIELVGSLVAAAGHSDGPMRQSEIDSVLGVRARRRSAGHRRHGVRRSLAFRVAI